MSAADLRARLGRVVRHPGRIPAYLGRRLDDYLHAVEGMQVIWPEPGRARLGRLRAGAPRGNDVLVRVRFSAVSPGTERAQLTARRNAPVAFPYRPGYSGSGEVIRVGENVTDLVPGTRVAGPLPHASLGVVAAGRLAVVPGTVTDRDAAFVELGLIALHGVRAAALEPGESAAVVGGGLIGQLTIQLLAAAGAHPITAAVRSDRRRALALEHGADIVRAGGARSDADEVGADVVFEASGNPAAIHDAIRAARPGGRVVLLGSSRAASRDLDLQRCRDAGLTLLGAHVTALPSPGSRERASVLALLADGRLRMERLVTDEIDPSEAELFYRRLADEAQPVLGALFRWDRLAPETTPDGAPRRPPAPPARVSAAAPAGRADETAPAAGTLRVGLVGCGEIAVDNARAVAEAENASLAMAMDVDGAAAEDLARRYAIPWTSDVERLLERDDVDAVLISTPHFLHAPLAVRAARAGKHVMVEKPMANSLAEADAMIEASRDGGVRLSVIYCQRYLPYVRKAKELIDTGALGRLLGLHVLHHLDRPSSYWTAGRTGRSVSDWRLSREQSGGGIVVFNLSHLFDLMRHLTGMEVTSVLSDLARLESPAETEDTVSISLRFDDRLPANVTAASCVRGAGLADQQLHVWGTEGHLVVGEPLRFYSLRRVGDHAPGQWHTLAEWEWGVERRRYVERFAAAVLSGVEPEVSAADGRAVQAVSDAIYASASRRGVVAVDGGRA